MLYIRFEQRSRRHGSQQSETANERDFPTEMCVPVFVGYSQDFSVSRTPISVLLTHQACRDT